MPSAVFYMYVNNSTQWSSATKRVIFALAEDDGTDNPKAGLYRPKQDV